MEIVDRDTATSLGTMALGNFDSSGVLTTSPSTITTATMTGLAGTGADLGAITIDLTETTQLGYKFNPDGGTIDGNAPSKVAGFQIDDDGIVYVKYENNKLEPRYRIALANVQSPDNLVPQSGNVYSRVRSQASLSPVLPGPAISATSSPALLKAQMSISPKN